MMALRRISHLFFLIAVTMGLQTPAHAGENVFGWIYTADTLGKGQREFEQQAFLQKSQSQGKYSNWLLRSEVEYGLTDNLQIAGYLNTRYVNAYQNGVNGDTSGPDVDVPSDFDTSKRYRRFRADSASVELIYRLLNPYIDPIGLALYIEPELGSRTRELETRLILQKNFLDDRLIMAANLMAKSERERSSGEIERASMLDTTFGFSYRFAQNMSAGLEYRNHREWAGYRFNSPEHSAHFLGPNFHYATKNWWATVAWRHQMKWVKTFNDEQKEAVVNSRIYGGEHARNELMFKVGFPF